MYRINLNLQKACILGTQEKPLNAEQRVFGNLCILMVHQFHYPVFCFQVSHNNSTSRMVLNELREIKASNCKGPWISRCVQNCYKDP